jgi:hypothetical protein
MFNISFFGGKGRDFRRIEHVFGTTQPLLILKMISLSKIHLMKIFLSLLTILLGNLLVAQQSSVEKSPDILDNIYQSSGRDTFNLQFQFPTAAFIGEYGIESDGDYIYVTQWRDDSIAKYDLAGNVVEIFKITGVSEVRDLAWDGTYFYGSPNDYKFYILDFTNKVLVNTCYTDMRIRGMAYDPDTDALWVSEHWSPSFFRISKTDGTTLDSLSPSGITMDAISGLAYDNQSPGGPFLWGFSQDSTGAMIVKYDIPNQAQTGNMIDVSSLASGAAYAGGLFIEEMSGMTGISIGGMIQNDQVFALELGYANTLVGLDELFAPQFTIFPNPVKEVLQFELNGHVIKTLMIIDHLGKVIYHENTGREIINKTIPVARLDNGIYYLQITDLTGKKYTKQFIKIGK